MSNLVHAVSGRVIAVNCDNVHRFSKPPRGWIRLIEGFGIEGDAHAGAMVKHRYLARFKPQTPNLRQVHLIHAELFDEVAQRGYAVKPGDLGENITTRGLDLLVLPLGARLHLGERAVVQLTGLRTPCRLIDKFQKGLLKEMIMRKRSGEKTFRVGVLGIVLASGEVRPGETVRVAIPDGLHAPLPPI